MKQFFTSASGLDARGVGPRIMLVTAPFLLAAVYFETTDASFTKMVPEQDLLTSIIGWIWLTAGLVFFFTALAQFIVNFPKGKLITSGAFSISRNPIYASWIVFVLPAVAMICNNWIFLAAALIMGVTTSVFVREEELQLLRVFGKQYAGYKSRVACIIGVNAR